MPEEMSITQQKMEEIGNEVKQKFVEAGEEAKEQIMKDFNAILVSDVKVLKKSLAQIVRAHNRKFLKQQQEGLQKAIKEQFGGNVFGDILSDTILPGVFSGIQNGSFRSGDFKVAAAQGLLEMGKVIARSQKRNG